MEIVIESDPYRPSSASPAPTYLRSSPQQPPPVSTNSAFYYATLPRGRSVTSAETHHLDGAPASTSVRRVDKSGLLEISSLEPPGMPRQTPYISHCATLSRRMDRPVLLEAVPEVPDQLSHREAILASARSMVERQQHLLGAETDGVESGLLRRRSFATDSQDSSSTTISVQTDVEVPRKSRVKFALDEVPITTTVLPPPTNFDEIKEVKEPKKSSVKDCLGRLSPRQRQNQQQQQMSNIPDVIEAHGTSTPASSTTSTVSNTTSKSGKKQPQGERAEAEGCEHTNIESVESYKGGSGGGSGDTNSKVDNIQAVHVIILSEQL